MGELVGCGVELGVGQRGVSTADRDRVGGGVCLGLEERGQGGGRDGVSGVVPGFQYLVALLGGEEVDASEGLVGVSDDDGF